MKHRIQLSLLTFPKVITYCHFFFLEVMMLYLDAQEVGMSFVDVVSSMEVTTTPRVQSLEHGMERCMEDKMLISCTTM